ncbi:hypothetical protein [Methylobacterium sp. GC_Met_2]|uniref:hypothetical protein n=1 Tax=Methylobacterium sp. GC_Met_2 TaxID=2937376 RepID=UPI00226BB33B|nr:hypothetical protein [Methylobacterium sp. GC_Met_2]
MSGESPPKSLKDQNRWPLWLTIAANFALFYVISQSDALASVGWQGLLTGAVNLLPVGLALIVTSVANGLLSAAVKARLVFLRWHHALPGNRAFSAHAPADPRIDLERLKKALGKKWPESPADQNRAWYRIYKEMEGEAAIIQVHREFLFTRDYAAFALLFLLGFGTAAVFLISARTVQIGYCLFLLGQFVVVRQAAATYGTRLVTTVLARKAAKPSRAARK